MTRRPAITLIEALVAIFVMAIGLLALLTLFPLGAGEMGQAMKDDRTAQACINATALFKAFDLGNDPNVNASNSVTNRSFFENPWPPTGANPAMPPYGLPALSDGFVPTYLAFVDPIGNAAGLPVVTSATLGNQPAGPPWPTVGGVVPSVVNDFGIPRATVSNIPTTLTNWQQRWFTLLDDLTFDDNGVPGGQTQFNANVIQREGRYTFAYMVRRQFARYPPPPVTPGAAPYPAIDLTIVVYNGRAPSMDPSGLFPLGETAYANTTFSPGPANSPNYVTIDYSATGIRPNLRRGSWVLDARMTFPRFNTSGVQVGVQAMPQGYFYRVVSVTDVSANVMGVELQQPLGGPMRGPSPANPLRNAPASWTYTGPLIVMENVSEVFEKETDY